MREETKTLYETETDPCPHLDIECFGIPTMFIVDTGCSESRVTYKTLELWGMPAADGQELIRVDMKLKGTIYTVDFYIENFIDNLLGTDFLCQFNCTLDLRSPMTLTLRDSVPSSTEKTVDPLIMLNVAGQDIEVVLDSGTVLPLMGSMSLAQKLNMSLIDVSHECSPITINNGT